jgi:polyisoprenoid-binding protein YceI
MKKTAALITFLLILATFTFAQTKTTITKSTIKFQIKNLGIAADGTIAGLQANIQFNAAQLSTSIIEASVDVNTINTDNDARDKSLKSDEFFDVAHYPKITMKSVSFKHKSGNKYTGQFNLTIKNKTKTFEVPFTYTETGNAAVITGGFKLNRLDFDIGDSSLVLSNDVAVNIEVEVSK